MGWRATGPAGPPLGEDLVAQPRRTRDLYAAGVSAREIAGPLWTPLARGLHHWRDAALLDPTTRILAAAELLPPGAAIGGWASLFLQGAVDLDGRGGPGGSTVLPVPVCIGPSGRIRRRPFLRVDRRRLPERDVIRNAGIPVTTAVRAASDVACDHGIAEGMVAGDTAARFGLLRAAGLRAYVRRRPRTTGLVAARRAADLVSERSKSRPETLLRYLWVVEAGLPVPMVNVTLVAEPGGHVLGEADLYDPEAALAGEYDGSEHRALLRHTRDNVREEAFEEAGIVVTRATAIDIYRAPRRLVWRLQRRRAQGLARDRSRDAWAYLPTA